MPALIPLCYQNSVTESDTESINISIGQKSTKSIVHQSLRAVKREIVSFRCWEEKKRKDSLTEQETMITN